MEIDRKNTGSLLDVSFKRDFLRVVFGFSSRWEAELKIGVVKPTALVYEVRGGVLRVHLGKPIEIFFSRDDDWRVGVDLVEIPPAERTLRAPIGLMDTLPILASDLEVYRAAHPLGLSQQRLLEHAVNGLREIVERGR